MPKTLDIITTQNVTIEYPLAGISDRVFAFIIDFIIILAIYFVVNIIGQFVIPNKYFQYLFYFTFFPVFIFYSLASEYFRNGQSWGKQFIGLKVVKINGSEARISDYVARWVFRIVDIYFSLGTVGMFLINSTVRAQRLGDIVANTTVIKIKPAYSPSLSHIENIKTVDNYEPVYGQVVQMSEVEMLEIKNILQEIKRYPNQSHRRQLEELRNYLCDRLHIQVNDQTDHAFIQQLINDYIVLTR
jgi:uncharacterized RDD family membrane protein YckC